MGRVQLLDRDDAEVTALRSAAIDHGVIHSDRRLQPERHFFPIEQTVGAGQLAFGYSSRYRRNSGTIVGQRRGPADHLFELLGDARGMLLVAIFAERVVAAASIRLHQLQHHRTGQRVGLLRRVGPRPVHAVVKRLNRSRRQLHVARAFAAVLERLHIVRVERERAEIRDRRVLAELADALVSRRAVQAPTSRAALR